MGKLKVKALWRINLIARKSIAGRLLQDWLWSETAR
jgi:hypothetical protein